MLPTLLTLWNITFMESELPQGSFLTRLEFIGPACRRRPSMEIRIGFERTVDCHRCHGNEPFHELSGVNPQIVRRAILLDPPCRHAAKCYESIDQQAALNGRNSHQTLHGIGPGDK